MSQLGFTVLSSISRPKYLLEMRQGPGQCMNSFLYEGCTSMIMCEHFASYCSLPAPIMQTIMQMDMTQVKCALCKFMCFTFKTIQQAVCVVC